jgi:chain length determinant protein (polysaccharide antigen chain regulator)
MIENEVLSPTGLFSCILSDQAKLLDIQNLNVDPSTIHVYRYVMKPDLPIVVTARKSALTDSGSAAGWDYWFRCGVGS